MTVDYGQYQDEERGQQQALQLASLQGQLQQALNDVQKSGEQSAEVKAAADVRAQNEESAAQQMQALQSQLAAQQQQSEAALQAIQQHAETSNQEAAL